MLIDDVLHHVVDERRTLEACFRCLKPGGVIGVVEGAWHPDFKELEASLMEEMRRFGTLENPFTTEYLDRCLRDAGFGAICRYASVDGLVPDRSVDLPVRAALAAPPEATNNHTARKPPRPGASKWRAALGVAPSDEDIKASQGTSGGAGERLSLVVTNTGTQALLGGGNHPGAVTLAVRRDAPGADGFVELCDRQILPRPPRAGTVGHDPPCAAGRGPERSRRVGDGPRRRASRAMPTAIPKARAVRATIRT